MQIVHRGRPVAGMMLTRQNLVRKPRHEEFRAGAPISQCNKFNAMQHERRF